MNSAPPVEALAQQTPQAVDAANTHDAHRARKAAEQFEAIFVRKMMSSMMAGTKVGGSDGSTIYQSMIVDGMADAIVKAGGLGLADMLARSITPSDSEPTP